MVRIRSGVGVLMLAGCLSGGGDAAPSAEWQSFEQKLELEIETHSVPVPLEGMDVWLTEDAGWPELFEIRGEGVALVGEFPRDV